MTLTSLLVRPLFPAPAPPRQGALPGGPARAASRPHVGGSRGGRSRVPARRFPARRFPALSRRFPALSRPRGESEAAPAPFAPSPVQARGLARCSAGRLGRGRAAGLGAGRGPLVRDSQVGGGEAVSDGPSGGCRCSR